MARIVTLRRGRLWLVIGLVAFPAGLLAGIRLARHQTNTAESGAAPDGEAPAYATTAGTIPSVPTAFPKERGGITAGGASEVRNAAAQEPVRQGAGPRPALPAGSHRYTPVVEAANRVIPSVVSITVLKTIREAGFRSLFEEFWNFGGRTRGLERTVRGLGSGFAIDADGYILTNEHVVAGADSMVVSDADGRVYPAELVGADELTDIAVIKIDRGRVPPAPIGTSADLVVGEPAIAIGNPFGYLLANAEATVTAGVVSGVGRDIRADEGETLLADMVQTDASINPGNSGGPLVNADGRVIGVNSSIFSRSGGSEGLGFAIPIDRATRIADELKRFGTIRKPYVGVDAVAVRSDTSLFSQTRIRRVAPGSPADRAGLEEGDVLLAIDGRAVNSPLDWEVGLLDAGVRAEVDVAYARAGRAGHAKLRVEELPSESAERLEAVQGLELITVTPQIAVERRLDVDSGAMVARISAHNATVTGMREGDVITQINRRRVDTAEDARTLFQYYAGRSRIRVVLNRDGRSYYTTFYVQ